MSFVLTPIGFGMACLLIFLSSFTSFVRRFTCPGRFLAVLDLKILAALVVTRYSNLVPQDEQKQSGMLASPLIHSSETGLYFTSRHNSHGKTAPSPTAALADKPKEN